MDVREKQPSEKRLIDANAMRADWLENDENEYTDVDIRDTDDVVKVFVPLRYGRWIDKGEYAVCTECGGRSGTQYDGVKPIPLMTQFCPNCGAIMDGGAD